MNAHQKLRIVYMGTPYFAVEPLKKLLEEGYNICAVVTAPDKPAGRDLKLQQSEIKEFALRNNLTVLQPTNLKDEDFLNTLHQINADLFVVVAFRMLPEVVWRMPSKGSINLHASLLPQYRGAAPINWAIINGESYTGVTTFFISHEIDTGNILLQERVEIKQNETAGELHDRLMGIGSDLLVETVKKIEADTIESVPQKMNKNLKIAPKLFKNNRKINWESDVYLIHNFIRGLSPYPAAWTEMVSSTNNFEVKIFKSEIEIYEHQYESGEIFSDGRVFIKIACNSGFINICELQLAGKKKMFVKEFLKGFKNINTFLFK